MDSSTPPPDAPIAFSPINPTDDHAQSLDLTRRLIRHPAATFFARAEGDSMVPFIQPGDLLVVDKSRTAVDGDIVIAVIDGDFAVRRLCKAADGSVSLVATHPTSRPLVIPDGGQLDIWGTVTAIVRELVKA